MAEWESGPGPLALGPGLLQFTATVQAAAGSSGTFGKTARRCSIPLAGGCRLDFSLPDSLDRVLLCRAQPTHCMWRLRCPLFLKKFIYLFIYGCVGSSFLCEGFLQLRQAGATLHCGARASHYRSLSCCGAQAPDAQAQ